MSQVLLIRLFAPFPEPDSLTVTSIPVFLVKYEANDFATGPTVVEPSITILFAAIALPDIMNPEIAAIINADLKSFITVMYFYLTVNR
jgi:hypothetical protein